MLPFRKILFPVDYSEPCVSMVPYVRNMTQHFNAELTVLHAYESEVSDSELTIADPSWPDKLQALQEERLKKFACSLFPSQHLETTVIKGEVGTAIRQHIQRQGADLVMMPTRGQGPLRRLLLGSVTAKVLHDVSAAVWTASSPMLESSKKEG